MNEGKTLMALCTGLLAGAVLGILFAPDKGSETRRKLSGSARGFAGQGKDFMINWKEKLTHEHAHNGNGHHTTARRNTYK